MSRKSAAAILAGALLAAIAATPAAADASLSAYTAYPNLDMVSISPDGTKLAFATFIEGKHVVVIQPAAGGQPLAGVDVSDSKLRNVAWADDDHILISSSETAVGKNLIGPRSEWWSTISYKLSDRSQHTLMADVGGAMNTTLGPIRIRHANGHTIAYVASYSGRDLGDHLFAALFAIDLTDDYRTTPVPGLARNGTDWIVDAEGNVVAESEYDEATSLWTLKLRNGADWRTVATVNAPLDIPHLSGLSEDGNAVLVRSADDKSISLKAYSLATGTPVDPPKINAGGDFIDDPVSHRVIGTVDEDMTVHYVFSSAENAALWHRARDAFSDSTQVELVSWSDDKTKMILHVFGKNEGDEYVLADLTAHTARPIGPVYANIGRFDIAPVNTITYKAADGTAIPAYLTLPRGGPAKNLPLVVFPHGGPQARDDYGFDWWAQAMAAAGYAVLQPQFRGSDGFGPSFLTAGYGQWGRKMQTDLSDGVRALAAQGTIDPKRVCIVGASYGGYAALAGATLDAGVYRCAASVAGIADLREMLQWLEHLRTDNEDPAQRYYDNSNNISARYMFRFLGVQNSDDPMLDAFSPADHVDKVTIPVLLVHGKDDTVVPIDQSEKMAAALSGAGKDVTFVKLDSEDHWLSHAETRAQMLDALMSFLAKNNPP